MRKTILLSTLAAIACLSLSRPQPMSAQRPAPPPKKAATTASTAGRPLSAFRVKIFQPDSPILVGDGSSIHFQKESGVEYNDRTHIRMQIDPSQGIALRVYGCNGNPLPSGCTAHFIQLGSGTTPWVATFYHTDKTLVAKLTFPDPKDGSYVDVEIPKGLHSTFSQVAGSGGTHVKESFFHLSYAMVGAATLGCPPPSGSTGPGGTGCEMALVPNN